ncbi:hypothetical protein K432DRAFT_386410 [Lepidopterella palustris CBS 459.81]|uniref:Uncharacterized protein n=1 Tax=Lepidopterella palustris CBS 459.81 TaxID=1314670 RepID=A0A8E2E0F3_9PEZI|nr:hypothetical protein K432DRAFT_386410 [Lepidopterella palustris CBS 459.81]
MIPAIFTIIALLSHVHATRDPRRSAQCPSKIEADITYPVYDDEEYNGYYGKPGPFRHLSDVYAALTSCSNITSLDLTIGRYGGCDVDDGPWNFDFKPGDKFPELEELRIRGYDFDDYWKWKQDRRDAGYDLSWTLEYTWMDMLTGNGPSRQVFPPKPTLPEPKREDYLARNLDQWLSVMDWNLLQVLEVQDPGPGFLMRMSEPGRLGRLRELKIVKRWHMFWDSEELEGWEDMSAKFIAGVGRGEETANEANSSTTALSTKLSTTSNITSLILKDVVPLSTFVESLLPIYGPSLTTLSIRYSPPCSDLPTYFNATTLTLLASTSPTLSTLTLDLPRNGSWPLAILDVLASIPNLQHLNAWLKPKYCPYPPGTYDEHDIDFYNQRRYLCRRYLDEQIECAEPRLDAESAYDVFVYIREKKAGMELLDLSLGEFCEREIVCSVLDKEGKRKREGIAWCVEGEEQYYERRGLSDGFVA